MSKITHVVIRTSEYLKKREVYDVILSAKDREIPLYYQYAQTTITQSRLPEQYKIGTATNIRDENGVVYCDVTLNDLLSLSTHFDNVIDNYTLKTNKSKRNSDMDYELVRFVVYDKEFKRKVDEEIVKRSESEQ